MIYCFTKTELETTKMSQIHFVLYKECEQILFFENFFARFKTIYNPDSTISIDNVHIMFTISTDFSFISLSFLTTFRNILLRL